MACSAPPGGAEDAVRTQEPIVGGTATSAYPEAALLLVHFTPSEGGYCTAALIAPQVVLTAGHCVYLGTGLMAGSWDVSLPDNRGQMATATSGITYDYSMNNPMGQALPALHDIGLVFLDKPMKVDPSQCPTLGQKALKAGTDVVSLGRIQNGAATDTVFASPTIPVTDGSSAGYPNTYTGTDFLEEGDSGGPVELPNTTPHQIIAVNSSHQQGVAGFFAKVDPLYDWIEMQIQMHGGPCTPTSASSDAGTSSDASGAGGGDGGGSSGGGSDGATGSGEQWNGKPGASGGCGIGRSQSAPETSALVVAMGAALAGVARRRRRP